jgi:hypothetical protein
MIQRKGGRRSPDSAGCSIPVASWQLEIPPVRANSMRTVDASARASPGPSSAARCCGWSGPCGEEFAPDKSASAGIELAELLAVIVSSTWRRNVLGAIAFDKNDCNFPWRRQPRRIRKVTKYLSVPTNCVQPPTRSRRQGQALPLRKSPEENRFRLTSPFRNGPQHLSTYLNGSEADVLPAASAFGSKRFSTGTPNERTPNALST